ncbi:molybdopterin-dependent oxidoreductase [Marinomonas sp.]
MRLAFCFFIFLCSGKAFSLEQPSGQVILSVSGDIKTYNANNRADFDLAMLNTLPQVSVTTHNPWTDGEHTYTGFSVMDLLKQLKNSGSHLKFTALNQYQAEIPLSDFTEHGAIMATHRDGLPMSIRNLGPIMVIYPFDQNSDLKIEQYYGRSIWQIKEMRSFSITE